MKQLCTFLLLIAFTQGGFAELSGPLSGNLGPGEFHVTDTIYVNEGDTLHLLPGTTFNFDGPHPFLVRGILLAEGTEHDSIMFTTDVEPFQDRWQGIRFLSSASSASRLSYCLISNACTEFFGGGILCGYNSSPVFSNCVIRHNRAGCMDWAAGGGIYCGTGSPSFINCIISNNEAFGEGGGIGCTQSSAVFTGCDISGNFAYLDGGGVFCQDQPSPIFTNCTFNNNISQSYGGGISAIYSSPTITNCSLRGNSAYAGGGACCWASSSIFSDCIIRSNWTESISEYGCGGGVYCSRAFPVFENCAIDSNMSLDRDGFPFMGGGGISCRDSSSPIFENCTIHGNLAADAAVWCRTSSPSFTNCTLCGNTTWWGGGIYCDNSSIYLNSTIIAYCEHSGIHFRNSAGSQITYCDFFDNGGGNIVFTDNDSSHGPDSIGELTNTNANDDSCDTYYNIFLDPMFVDTASGDYHLLEGSPCIDAGDPELPYDPDTTIADIGAFYYHQTAADIPAAFVPASHALHPNFPNPFNPTTTIRYDVKQTGHVQLAIYNLLGQEVTTLVNDRHLAGSYTILWNASDLPSGMYLCRMETANFVQTQKLILLK